MNKTIVFLICAWLTVSYGAAQAQGFIHPGALHTQADFDRVKAQLAAGDPTVTTAYNNLKNNAYSSSTTATYPVERIVRGGSGENYMNAARGAAMAYQNALRWKISGDAAYAERAILILNSWAATCKAVGGDTNQSLASGLYGYAFANAAELMRDYEGWNPAEFKKFQEWMLYVWYPRCIDFLKRRHDTWTQGRPGHYWSNWGLCNTLAVMSIGILCDDVFIYNQGVSYYKYDQVGGSPHSLVENDNTVYYNGGLTEYLGNLVPVLHADERGPFGFLGQMQESGRDQGHALMALGLAVDVAQVGWNQGDDLFGYMDNRLVAGIEYLAAYNSGVNDLPWTEYWYHDVRTALQSSWRMTGNNEGGRSAFRPYWDRILGHYEGIKGITMNYSHTMKNKENIDNGGGAYGQTSGGFDHLGFSTLMCTRPAVTADQAPVILKPAIIYRDNTYERSEYSGVSKGSTVKFVPQLPEGVANTGNWLWSTGDATQDLEITANNSAVYRVTYTSANGVKSTQLFTVAVTGDCTPDRLTPAITVNGVTYNDTIITIMPRTTFTLAANPAIGWGKYKWNTNATASSITVQNISSERTYSVTYTNQFGKESQLNFHIKLSVISPSLSVAGGAAQETNTAIITAGQSVELKPTVQSGADNGVWRWSNGSASQNLLLENIQETEHHSVHYTYDGREYSLDFHIYVIMRNKGIVDGDYFIKDASTGQYLTNNGAAPIFDNRLEDSPESQTWTITKDGTRYKIVSKPDNRFLNEYGTFSQNPYYTAWNSYALHGVSGGNLYAIQNGGSAGTDYWTISSGSINGKGSSTMSSLPFEIISVQMTGMSNPEPGKHLVYPNPATDHLIVNIASGNRTPGIFTVYSIDGQQIKNFSCSAGENNLDISAFPKGLYLGILNIDGQTETIKIIKK
ncbi:MAG: alginate lyase family protein [Dysgonamonadaceae bacterium]|jgi:hypothetical protein|nr:alginate lyase family protein [Dysgonamonadaceae bacterium]